MLYFYIFYVCPAEGPALMLNVVVELKVRPVINFYVKIITSYCFAVQPESHRRYSFVRQLIPHFKGVLPDFTATHITSSAGLLTHRLRSAFVIVL